MSWAPGWYGWDVDSEDAAAWGPFATSDEAKWHPDVYAPDDAEVRVFYISASDTPRHRYWSNDIRQRAIWVDGPDSEAARAGRRENPGCHAWYACDDASVSVRPRGGLVRIATTLNPADLDPGQAEELARHLQACAAWLRHRDEEAGHR